MAMGVEEKEISLLPTSENTKMEAFDFTNKFGTNNTLIIVTELYICLEQFCFSEKQDNHQYLHQPIIR